MSNVTHIGIINDQDRAMKKAIEIVFPNTRHRWCLWHILKKVPEKLGGYTEYHAITQLLHSAVKMTLYLLLLPFQLYSVKHGYIAQ